MEEEETLLEVATSDVAQLCAENVILWTQYLELVTANDSINHILAKQHHTERVSGRGGVGGKCEWVGAAGVLDECEWMLGCGANDHVFPKAYHIE